MFYVLLNFVCLLLLVLSNETIDSTVSNELDLTFGHEWDERNNQLKIYFDISNSSFYQYRYYYYDFRPFGQSNHVQYFPRQRLMDRRNSLLVVRPHEGDYVACISLIDYYENIYKPRFACHELTLGEKTVGSHHQPSSGYLSPLLVAVVFVLHLFIAIIHYVKAKQYAQKLLNRFINVNGTGNKRFTHVKHSLEKLDRVRPSVSIQRRLSRVSIDGNKNEINDFSFPKSKELPIFTLSNPLNPRLSISVMNTIPELNP